jgi:hypothetical protein
MSAKIKQKYLNKFLLWSRNLISQPYKKPSVFLLSFLFLGIFLLPNSVFASSITPEKIIELTNQERANVGMEKLTANQILAKAAYDKADAIFNAQTFEHTINGQKFSAWVREAGYQYNATGENLAIDFNTSEGVMKAWLASASHKENLLNPQYKEIGVAVKEGKFENENSIVVVQIFGDPVATPIVKGVTENNIAPSVVEAGSTIENKFSNNLAGDVASGAWPFAAAFIITLILYQTKEQLVISLRPDKNYIRYLYAIRLKTI